LKRQIYDRRLQEPLDRGRIYRVTHESMRPGPPPRLSRRGAEELVDMLSHRNGWWRDTAQRLLVERGETQIGPALRRLAASEEWEVARLHALWTLEGLRALKPDHVRRALEDRNGKVRAAAVRLAEPWLRKPGNVALHAAVLGKVDEDDAGVRLQVALSLGEM